MQSKLCIQGFLSSLDKNNQSLPWILNVLDILMWYLLHMTLFLSLGQLLNNCNVYWFSTASNYRANKHIGGESKKWVQWVENILFDFFFLCWLWIHNASPLSTECYGYRYVQLHLLQIDNLRWKKLGYFWRGSSHRKGAVEEKEIKRS